MHGPEHPEESNRPFERSEAEELESDLRLLHYQKLVVDAALLEGVDVSIFIAYSQATPDPTLQRTISHFYELAQGAKERAIQADIDSALGDLAAASKSVDFWTREHNLALGVQQTAWARLHIDEYGTAPDEAKIGTQLQFYTLPEFNAEERRTWLGILDRVIPESPGLDPTDPQTAIEIERWA